LTKRKRTNNELQEKFGDAIGVIRSRLSKDRQYNDQKKKTTYELDKQWSTKHYTEKKVGVKQVLWKG